MHKTNDNIFFCSSATKRSVESCCCQKMPVKNFFFTPAYCRPSIAAIRLVLFSCMLTQAEKCCTIKT